MGASCGTSSWWAAMQLITMGCSPCLVATSTPSCTWVPSCSCVSTLPMSCRRARRFDDLLDATRMEAPVGDQALECEASHFAPHRIEARHDHGIRRVVDDHVHAGRGLERPDVAAFATDDAALHRSEEHTS